MAYKDDVVKKDTRLDISLNARGTKKTHSGYDKNRSMLLHAARSEGFAEDLARISTARERGRGKGNSSTVGAL
jgi:hypothetical protein